MESDIVARLRDLKNAMDECGFTGISAVTNAAADEIERLREQVKHHARDRIEYCAAWLKWIEGNDGLDIAQWCRAYADAIPYPNPDGPDIASVIHSRLDARHRMAADEIERLRSALLELREAADAVSWTETLTVAAFERVRIAETVADEILGRKPGRVPMEDECGG